MTRPPAEAGRWQNLQLSAFLGAVAAENARLLRRVEDRRVLLERLFQIQRSISRRAPVQLVLDAIAGAAAEVLGAEVVGIRLVDEHDPSYVELVASVGVSDEVLAVASRTPIGGGVGGQALVEDRLVATSSYAQSEHPLQPFVATGLQAAMAAPVHRDGAVVGSLVVATARCDRVWSAAEQETLLYLAEHTSIALNDASAQEAMRRAFDVTLHRATHDPLTGLPNRSLVLDRLGVALARHRRSGETVAVLFIDLDRFKAVNDSLGHSVGDEVLVRVAERLAEVTRPEDTVGRLSGDEFVVIGEQLTGAQAVAVAKRIADAISEPFHLYGRETVITPSVGVAFALPGAMPDDVLRDADMAMYRAKEHGRARVEVFDQAMRVRIIERVEVEQALRRAVRVGDLRLHFQPIIELASGCLAGFEALVRWQDPARGLVMPDGFISVAEESDLILDVGAWVLDEACTTLARWRHAGGAGVALKVSVNLSGRQFADPSLVEHVGRALFKAGMPAGALCLELTESVVMDEADHTVATLRSLKELGVSLSIDDFGTGYSSLSYLRRFPVDELKVDKGFVDGLGGGDEEDEAIVAAVISLGHVLGLEVVAEGVETVAQLEHLGRLGCDRAQGYLLGRPAEAATAQLAIAAGPTIRPAAALRARRSNRG